MGNGDGSVWAVRGSRSAGATVAEFLDHRTLCIENTLLSGPNNPTCPLRTKFQFQICAKLRPLDAALHTCYC